MESLLTIDFLDKALLYIKKTSQFTPTMQDVNEFTPRENKLLIRALYKLEKDGYVFTTTTNPASGNNMVTFYISFDGLLALEKSSIFRPRNQPYKNQKITQRIQDVIKFLKIIIIVINSIAILYLMWRAIPG